MVHALLEIQGVLKSDGRLIDLRPLLDRWPVEVSWPDGHQEAGRATDLSEPLADDAAANSAMAELVAAGRLIRERGEVFSIFYYWDTAKEMQEYIAEEWSDVVEFQESLWSGLRSAWATADAQARVRLRVKMLITRYRMDQGSQNEGL